MKIYRFGSQCKKPRFYGCNAFCYHFICSMVRLIIVLSLNASTTLKYSMQTTIEKKKTKNAAFLMKIYTSSFGATLMCIQRKPSRIRSARIPMPTKMNTCFYRLFIRFHLAAFDVHIIFELPCILRWSPFTRRCFVVRSFHALTKYLLVSMNSLTWMLFFSCFVLSLIALRICSFLHHLAGGVFILFPLIVPSIRYGCSNMATATTALFCLI